MNDASAVSPRAHRTRQGLLAAAARVLAERGFESTTSTAVAAEAGVATGTFYAYFSDKHVLLAELFAGSLDALVDAQEQVLTADMLLDEGLEATLARAVDVCVDGFRHEGPVLRAALARIPVDAELRRIYWGRHDRAVRVAERFLRRAEAAGAVDPADPADPANPADVAHRSARAQALVVLLQGLNHPVVLADQAPAAVRQHCVTALLGLLARHRPAAS